MRRWSELAERVAATTRTSEKTALLADYLRDLAPDELPIAAVFLTGRPFPEADQRATGIGWAAIAHGRRRRLRGDARGPRRGVRPLLRPRPRRGRRPDAAPATRHRPRARRPCPRSRPRSPRSRPRPGPRARPGSSRSCSRGPTRRPPRPSSRSSAASCGSACARASSRRRSRRRSTARSTTSSGPGCSPATSGRLAELARDDQLGERRAGAVPPAQVHARVAGRGRRRDHRPPRTRGLGRGQVRRHPRPAPQARRRRPAVLARPARHQRPVPGDRRGGTAAAVGRHPRRRDPRLEGRAGAAVHQPPGATRPQGPVRRDPGRGAGHLRRVRRAGARPGRRP